MLIAAIRPLDRACDPRRLVAASQARDLALHGRRDVAPRNVRLQAEARRNERPADARVDHQGATDRPVAGAKAELLRAAASVQEISANRGRRSAPIFPHIGQGIADEMCIIRSLHTEAINHDPAHTFMNTGSMIAGRSGDRVVADCMDWAARPTSCRVSSSWCRPENSDRSSRSPRGNGTRASCPADFRASSFAARATPCCTSSSPSGVECRPAARHCRCRASGSTASSKKPLTTRRSPPGSANTRWPFVCNRACRS